MSPFTIPNESGAGFADQAEPDKVDLDILTAGLSHGTGSAGSYGVGPTGVETGLAVTAQGVPDMTVAVATGTCRIGGRYIKVTGANVTITAADATNPRIDLITVDTAAALAAVAGTAASNAVFPAIPAGRVVLAAVYVPANDTAINTNQITDKRVMIDEPPHENVKWYGAVGNDSANDQAAIQAAVDAAYDTSLTFGRSRTVFFPRGIYRVNTTITLREGICLEGVGKPATDGRLGSWVYGNASSISVFTVPDDATLRQNGFVMRNLGIGAVAALTGITGVRVYNMNRWLIEDCSFLGADDAAMAIGLFAAISGAFDCNWNNCINTEFRRVVVGFDSYNNGLSLRGCHFVSSSTQTANWKGAILRADAAGTSQNIRIIDSEFVIPTNGVGVHIQGGFNRVIASQFEGTTSSTGNIGIKIEKVVGSVSGSGRRNEIIGCSFSKANVAAIEIGANVTETSILAVDYTTNVVNLSDSGTQTAYIPTTTGEIAKLATALDWPQITAPASPATGFYRFYVDSADTIFKSKNSAGTISVYGARTRALFIDGSVFRMDAATGVKLGTPPNAIDGVQLADGLTSGAYCNFIMPVDVITGTVTVRPIWAPNATDAVAHTVKWQMNIKVLNAADVTAAGTSVAWTGDSATRTVNVEVLETGQASTGVSPAASDRIRLEIQRVGADVADTYVGAVNLLGLRVDYQANN